VDLKTAWVIDGFGHGHQDLEKETDPEMTIDRDEKSIVASAAVLPFTEITPENRASFHFHGQLDDFPISSILVFTTDQKSNTLLEGRYESHDGQLQFVRPAAVIRELMSVLFRIQRFFDANATVIAVSTAALLALVMLLSARLRQREMETLFKLGCARGTAVGLQAAELVIVVVVAATLVMAVAWFVWRNADSLFQAWVNV
jgi:putative ABC transport system permease protein